MRDVGAESAYISPVQTRYIALSALEFFMGLAPGACAPGWDMPPLWGWFGGALGIFGKSYYRSAAGDAHRKLLAYIHACRRVFK